MRLSVIFVLILILVGCSNNSTPIPTDTNSPKVSETPAPTKDVPQQKVTEKTIGEYVSKMTNNEANRISNIKLAIKSINGYTLESNNTFSFNKATGPTDKKNGYKKAIIYVDGDKEMGYGGGVCQLSSTIYNAALAANLEIVERHPHKGPSVKYVPENKDATVSYGSVDFKMKNNRDNPIKIYASISNDGVDISIKEIIYE